jgi:hypothetical protein
MNKFKSIICFMTKHKIIEEKCPYTLKTYQKCLRCNASGIKK